MTRTEKRYCKEHGIKEPPRCYCGTLLKFKSYKAGYAKYCSSACANKDPNKKQLTKEKLLAKYGVENISQLDSIKKKKAGRCNKGHGKPWTPETRSRFVNTMRTKYGVDHPSQLPDYVIKRESTWLNKYGVKHVSELERIKNSKRNKIDAQTVTNHPDILNILHENGQTTYICECPTHCRYSIPSSIYYDRVRIGAELCTICQPIGCINKSKLESFVENILQQHNIKYVKHARNILGGRELDFYIPSHKLAIECNGVYWHSDTIKTDKKYHLQKYLDCKDQGIQLIQIWEDWIVNKPDIITNIVLSKFGIFNERIGARQCSVCEISQIETDEILKYHIQGTLKARHRFGLFYNGRLVSCMVFNKSRKNMMGNSGEGVELSRFCTLPGVQIIGGASKLLKYFISHFNPSKIVSFSSNDISIGSLYKQLGFEGTKQISCGYWYIHNKSFIRYHRYHFRKSALKKMGYVDGTEFEIMNKLPYHRIYDSGTQKWVWIKKEDQ